MDNVICVSLSDGVRHNVLLIFTGLRIPSRVVFSSASQNIQSILLSAGSRAHSLVTDVQRKAKEAVQIL